MAPIELAKIISNKLDIALDASGFATDKLRGETINSLALYLELINRWTARVDLVATAPTEVLIERHIVDSVLAERLIQANLKVPLTSSFLDIGTGAGLPGVVLALLEPARQVYLCEPREKRVMFLKEVKRELRLENVSIIRKRVEEISVDEVPATGITITRALGLEELFIRESKRLTSESGFAVLMTGPNWVPAQTNEPMPLPIQVPYSLPTSNAQHQLVVWRFERSSS